MRHYIALIHKDRESDFGISFPDFPGCISAGSTLEEAASMAAEALSGHVRLDGRGRSGDSRADARRDPQEPGASLGSARARPRATKEGRKGDAREYHGAFRLHPVTQRRLWRRARIEARSGRRRAYSFTAPVRLET
ncbi:MAG: type II toxin-antitoxin system HicB family antitoxin [Hyphomicrobiales bacterium]|nr:type II toxin-antitoxin system HicB family antitoxin [Hyphomicrobiales bacterium]